MYLGRLCWFWAFFHTAMRENTLAAKTETMEKKERIKGKEEKMRGSQEEKRWSIKWWSSDYSTSSHIPVCHWSKPVMSFNNANKLCDFLTPIRFRRGFERDH